MASHAKEAIPKIIHQTWKTTKIPREWQNCVTSWQECHPDWEYRLWTDDDGRQFVKRNYPAFLEVFQSYSYDIQRADAIRYLVLCKYGGLYVDLDVECLRPVDDILSNRNFVIGREPRKHADQLGEDSLICNAFMASIPNHPLLVEIIRTMETINPRITFHHEVLRTTGPAMLSGVLKKYAGKDLFVLEDYVVYPFTSGSDELDTLINKAADHLSLRKKCIKNGTYAIHYWANSWVRDLAGELKNPNPFAVEGYHFYPGVDSPGYDIGNVGRNVTRLVSECSKNYQALGFNTDGFLKYHVRPRSQWVKIDNRNGNEGLYIKKCARVS